MRDIPADVLSSWPKPNYIDPETRGNSVIIITVFLLVTSLIVVVVRLYTRAIIKRSFGFDDTFIALSMVFVCLYSVTVVLATERYGWKLHIYDIPPHEIENSLKAGMAAKVFWIIAASLTRMSLLCFYKRVASNTSVYWFNRALITAQFLVVAFGVITTTLVIFLCSPVSAFWTFPPKPSFAAQCLNDAYGLLYGSIVNTIMDLMVALLPIPVIWQLTMPLRRRVGVIVLFGLGFVVIVAGAVRIFFVWEAMLWSHDETWYTYPLWISSIVEVDLGVICACLPAIRPLFARRRPVILGEGGPSRRNPSSPSRFSKGMTKFAETMKMIHTPSAPASSIPSEIESALKRDEYVELREFASILSAGANSGTESNRAESKARENVSEIWGVRKCTECDARF